VERFASREPDRRLAEWLASAEDAASLRVLDIGCAGGRNAELLARLGCDLYAIDASEPMLRRTRSRLVEVLGEREAARRVRFGRMEMLGAFGDRSFDLVVALGVFHSASDRSVFERALQESARVLETGGHLLVSNFAPGTELEDLELDSVEGEPGVYEGHEAGRMYMLEAQELDEAMARYGLYPATPTATVEVVDDSFRRITVNGLYRKNDI
jgi:SAM-dependent methyltransferase